MTHQKDKVSDGDHTFPLSCTRTLWTALQLQLLLGARAVSRRVDAQCGVERTRQCRGTKWIGSWC